MAMQLVEIGKLSWRTVCPWVEIFRCLGLALRLRMVVLGMLSALMVSLGNYGHFSFRDLLESAPQPSVVDAWPCGTAFGNDRVVRLDNDFTWLSPLVTVWKPISGAADHFQRYLNTPRPETFLSMMGIHLWTMLFVGMLGGMMCRMTALDYAREETVGFREAGKYAGQRWLDYLAAPGLPMLGFYGVLFFSGMLGWLFQSIPADATLMGLPWGIVLVANFCGLWLLIATAVGWPMMVAAISCTGGDGFDGMSRGFSFVFDRWRYYLWCAVLGTGYGLFCMMLLNWGVYWLLTLTLTGFTTLTGPLETWSRIREMPREFLLFPASFGAPGSDFWTTRIARCVLTGIQHSLFWTISTLIFLILRKSADDQDLREVYIDVRPGLPPDLNSLVTPTPSQPDAASASLLPILNQPAGK